MPVDNSEYYKKYRAEHRDEIKRSALKYYYKHHAKCIEAKHEYRKNHADEIRKQAREHAKKYRKENREHNLQLRREWAEINREKVNKYARESRKRNHEKVIACIKKWRSEHKKEISDYSNRYIKTRREKVPEIKIIGNMRSKIRNALKSQSVCKREKTIELLGCNIDELKKHLESLFEPGMDWSNYAVKGWHIDHIRPCASFDLTKEEERRLCFNWSNLQPLWAIDNLIKGCKYAY
jgi:hypothetical protein